MVRVSTKGMTDDNFGQTNDYPAPGLYHVEITRWDDSEDKVENKIMADFTILNGTVPGQEGKRHTEFFPLSSQKGDKATADCLRRIALCAAACGAVAMDEDRDISPGDMVGQTLIVAIDEREYQGKKRSSIGFNDFWPVGHQDVSDVPLGEGTDVPFDDDLNDI